jgi:hypothetical protein
VGGRRAPPSHVACCSAEVRALAVERGEEHVAVPGLRPRRALRISRANLLDTRLEEENFAALAETEYPRTKNPACAGFSYYGEKWAVLGSNQ